MPSRCMCLSTTFVRLHLRSMESAAAMPACEALTTNGMCAAGRRVALSPRRSGGAHDGHASGCSDLSRWVRACQSRSRHAMSRIRGSACPRRPTDDLSSPAGWVLESVAPAPPAPGPVEVDGCCNARCTWRGRGRGVRRTLDPTASAGHGARPVGVGGTGPSARRCDRAVGHANACPTASALVRLLKADERCHVLEER